MKKFLMKLSATLFLLSLFLGHTASGVAAAEIGQADGSSESVSGFPLLKGEIRFRLPELLFPAKKEEKTEQLTPEAPRRTLIPGGMAFGVRLRTDGVLVVGMSDSSSDRVGYDAGLRIGDLIVEIDKTPIKNATMLTDAIQKSEGNPLCVRIKRGEEMKELSVTPKKGKDGRYLIGVTVRDGAAGIGTVTYIDPETGEFGGLGHGICDSSCGALIPMRRGAVLRVLVDSIEKGTSGEPGEIRGALCPDKIGTLLSNTHCGVFGVLASKENLPAPLPVAGAGEVKAGKATLRCTLDNGEPAEYDIEIGEIRYEARHSKCFAIRVIDPDLIEKTGGIVQGMSGSPIIQNGKLVGAVTHVLINDPTTGYGIFIENMLNAAHIPMQTVA